MNATSGGNAMENTASEATCGNRDAEIPERLKENKIASQISVD